MAEITALVPECNLEALEAAIATLNKRCRRLGLPEITISQKFDHVKARVSVLAHDGHINKVWMLPEEIPAAGGKWPHTDSGVRMAWHEVTVTGETPRLNGWEFVAVLEPLKTDDGEVVNLIQCLPGKDCPIDQRQRINVCDHCQANRRRSQTFVVYNAETNEHKSVGRQCIKDFLGYHESPENLIAMAEMLASLGDTIGGFGEVDEEGYGNYRERAWDMAGFMELVATRIRLFGWLSATKARETWGRQEATKTTVLKMIQEPSNKLDQDEQEELLKAHPVIPADKELAEAAMAWARELPNEKIEGSDYLANVNLVSRMGLVSRKTAGVAASIIPTYQREMELEVKRQEFARRPESFHVGDIGKRIDILKVKCEKVIMNETAYGVTGIHKMTTETGSDLVWFASQGRQLEEGQEYHVSATVKAHEEYKGRKQTVLTRVAVLTDEYVATQVEKANRKAAREAKKAAKLENAQCPT